MASGTPPYLLDANAFIDIGERFYPDDIFGCVWTVFSSELAGSGAVSIKTVLDELAKFTPLPAWRNGILTACKPNVIDEGDADIQTAYARLAPLASKGGPLPAGLSDTDLFILATAECRKLPIVTRDREITLSCDRGIVAARAIEPAVYFREKGWVFN